MTDLNGTGGTVEAGFTRIDSADAWSVARFRKELSQWLRAGFALDAARLNDVLLAVNEALTNAAEFAYAGESGTMRMQVRYYAAEGTLVIDVSDTGTWRPANPKTRSNTRGRGIPLMRALADRTTISPLPTGTEVKLQFAGCARIAA
ncbi:MAG: hypothetical protein QOD39_4608 [Mycobacterium sp.]|jgi:anti-sigma regulatory factor (Ser/Thr protein kinase)|nr:hypothetical protein [Mycobacterium sp.]